MSGNPFEASGQWTVQSSLDAEGWRGALVIPTGPGREHVTLTATVPHELARRFGAALRAVFRREHDRLHTVEGMELVGAMAAEIGVPWWQQILPGITSLASRIPVVGPVVQPFAQLAQSAFGGTPLPELPGLSALAQTGPGPRAIVDIPGAPGGLLAAMQGASGALGPLFGGAGLLAHGAQLVSGSPEHFGPAALELCDLLERALRILDCHAAAHCADPQMADRAVRVLSVDPAPGPHADARAMVDAMLPGGLHVSGYEIGAAPRRRPGPASGRVGPRRAPGRPAQVDAKRSAGLWKAAALAALQRGDKAHAIAILKGA